MSFSSDSSDFEEFYDAVEGTPNSSVARSPRSPGDGMTEIERQELRLLQLRQEAEERRRREDAEFEKMMEQLRRQKATCSQDAAPRPDRAQDLQHRRQKLAEMRKRIGQETSLIYTSQDSVTDPESPDSTKELQLPSQPQTTKSATIERMENSAHAYNKELVATARRKRSGSWGDLPKDLSDLKLAGSGSLAGSQLGSMEGVPEAGRGKPELRLPDSHSPPRECQASPEPRAVVDDVIKDINIGGDSQEEGSMGGEEPDIVKSTKPKGASPAPLSLPLAPPRRRKRSQTSSAAPRELDAPLPPLADPPTPVSTVASLTRELEHSLDLRSAIGGNRHITSEEADLEAVKSDTEMVDDFQVFSLEEATDDELMGGSDDETRRRHEKLPPSKERSGSRLHPDRLPAEKTQSSSPGSEEPSLSELHGRPRSNSGRLLTDEEILESVMILNLDTGERIPLNKAEEALPKCLNPLSMHIMQRTKEFSSDSSLPSAKLSDDDDARSEVSVSSSISNIGRRRPAKKLKKLFGRTVSKIKSVTEQVLHGDEGGIEEEVSFDGKIFKIKASGSNKGQHDFTQLSMLQDLSGEHTAAVWTMKFSPCGKLLATGGQDSVLRIWVLKSAVSFFEDLRSKCSSETTPPKMTKAQSKESVTSTSSAEVGDKDDTSQGDASTARAAAKEAEEEEREEEQGAGERVGGKEEDEDEHDRDGPFVSKPFCCYRGHQADLLDVAWSKNYFILSSSMDKTVRLWHISRRECLCTFQHIDFVTAIAFHPRDDRYFLSGSLDGKLRLWNIPDKKVTMWNEVRGSSSLITSASFCHQGKYAVAGTYDGKCIFFNTENLKYFTQIHVRSTRGRNAKGKKITGIEPMPNEDKILVTSNDSRIRLYDLRDLTLTCKYKGCTNTNSQIKAGFSSTAKYIICGSEDHFVYIWKAHHDFYKFSSARRDRNDYWEAIKVHNAVVTSAVFAPFPAHFSAAPPVPPGEDKGCAAKAATAAASSEPQGEIIVSADFTGAIKVIQNRPRS